MGSTISMLLYGLSIILAAAGMVGCILPYPGHLLILGACISAAFANGAPYPAWWVWGLLTLLMVFGSIVDNITTMMGARRFGSSKAAMWGTLPGIIIGAFFPPFGLIIGPFAGAFLAEILFARKNARASAASGLGATLGYLAGVIAKLIIAGFMLLIYLIF
ncbi:MAG: DUF456 domain-containing protein [Akkermansia sp.]|nr:DUF456 domain-containing protein [Akkermansia sp.]